MLSPSPISEKQREAARQNGSKSQGPRTPEGKAKSRRNALKHGLTGAGIVLPDELSQEVQAELTIFEKALKPRDDFERRLVEKAALSSIRWLRLIQVDLTHTADRVREATRRWDESREDHVADLAARLDDQPAEALRLLTRCCEGCDYLADAWATLRDALERFGSWDASESLRALHLLGLDRPPTRSGPPWQWEIWRQILAVRLPRDPEGVQRALGLEPGPLPIVRGLPDPATARTFLLDLIDEQAAELAHQGEELWQSHDRPDRESAPNRALFDPGPEASRLARYLADADRTERRALALLAAHRRDDARSRRDLPPPPPPAPRPRPDLARPGLAHLLGDLLRPPTPDNPIPPSQNEPGAPWPDVPSTRTATEPSLPEPSPEPPDSAPPPSGPPPQP